MHNSDMVATLQRHRLVKGGTLLGFTSFYFIFFEYGTFMSSYLIYEFKKYIFPICKY